MLVPHLTWTNRADGDLAGDLSVARPTWTWLRQVPDAGVVAVTEPGEHAGVEADALRARDDEPQVAHLGPCIRPGCYEFDGPGLAAADVAVRHDRSGCTACDRRWSSHRARGEAERVAATAWLEVR